MVINEIDQCTTVQKLTKEGEERYAFQWLWIKWRVVSTNYQLEVELISAEHDLD
jgi:hypothetical protein